MNANETLPAWDLTSIYSSINDSKLSDDEELASEYCRSLNGLAQGQLDVPRVSEALTLARKATILAKTIENYLRAVLSIDYVNEAAQIKIGRISKLIGQLEASIIPFKFYLQKCTDDDFDQIVREQKVKSSFYYKRWRDDIKLHSLGSQNDSLAAILRADGHTAWTNLYYSLVSHLKVSVSASGESNSIGVSQALTLFTSPDEEVRKSAWLGVQSVWRENQETAASIANALAGWRLSICSERANVEGKDFLSEPLFQNNIQKATLNSMLSACEDNRFLVQKCGERMAAKLDANSKQLAPWNLLAPYPDLSGVRVHYTFDQAIEMIKEAFASVSPELSDFVQMIVDKNWIEARVLSSKSAGAYCTEFYTNGEPRVFMSFSGTIYDVKTLAHELGHAYHSWLLRDLPYEDIHHPMTLSETASVFAENILRGYFLEKATTEHEKEILRWDSYSACLSFLINIPTRFEYEKSFYENRREGYVPAKTLCELMDKAWRKWYGSLAAETDSLYWAHKLHFSLSNISFYNFPYTFGFLFSSNLYSEFKSQGPQFFDTYKEILFDTGRMSAEALVLKHFGQDIRQIDFWDKAIKDCLRNTCGIQS